MTATPIHCLECHAPLSPTETQGLCARCLLRMGLASGFGESSVAAAGTRKIVPPPMFPFDFGGYRVLRLLGRGGMGAVYEAEQRDSGRRVALKVLGHTIDSPEMRARFMREGRLAAAVNHPNSVYIFGTEEIEGAPVIAMELVAGGTLRDRLRKGPLPVREAVDAILHIVDGLEAAAGSGVLHRDVKPANCFVAPDGTVKVGDFGLSVSTLARNDTELTASGVMLGTPSFAPPEQLKGEELDVRADIYSVGATLYSLLTGKPPFEGDNAVQVVAAVLDKAPRTIPNIPTGLAKIVTRCLAKKRDERFPSYAALRDALLPFSANVPEPAPLGLRFIAGVVDWFVIMLPTFVSVTWLGQSFADGWTANRSLAGALPFFANLAWCVAYFAISEARWGTTLGKALCGLRVMGPDGGRPAPGRAASRASLYVLGWELAGLLTAISSGPSGILESLGLLFPLLLFVTMRRRNGLAALHELTTRTRTVLRSQAVARPRLEMPMPAAPAPGEGGRLGPYRVLGPVAGSALLAGYDEVLRRHVWIHLRDAGTPPLVAARREVGRATRLRWIGGVRSLAENWDAFEAPIGRPLRELSAQPWSAVRGWLHDLAEEIDAAAKDGTLPTGIGLDHVWITGDGRAELLDEPWPAPTPAELQDGTELAEVQRFLSAVASHALDGTSLPVQARDFLARLAAGAFDRVSFIAGNLQSLLSKPATISRGRRAAALGLLPGAALFFSMMLTLMVATVIRGKNGPEADEWRRLEIAVGTFAMARGERKLNADFLLPRPTTNPEVAALAADYISGHFRPRIERATFASEAKAAGLQPREVELAQLAVAERPQVSPDRLEDADRALGPAMLLTTGFGATLLPIVGPVAFLFLLAAIALGSLVGVLLFGYAPVLQLFGFAVVDRTGRPASRGRLLARAMVVWGLPLAGGLIFLSDPGAAALIPAALGAVAFLIGVPWTIARPARGPHDQLCGTHVVPH